MKVVFEVMMETDNPNFFKKVADEDAADACLDGYGFPEHLKITSKIVKKEGFVSQGPAGDKGQVGWLGGGRD